VYAYYNVILFFKYTDASLIRHFETRRYLLYLILCSIVIHSSCLNVGSDGAMVQNEELSLNINFKQLQHSVCEQLLVSKLTQITNWIKKTKSVLKYHQKSIFFLLLRNI
jgi:hypothetical protein